MVNKAIKIGLCSAVITAAMAVSAFAASLGGGVVTASALNLRSAPSTGSSVITVAPNGANLVVTDDAGDGWYKVIYNESEGYMSAEFVELTGSVSANLGSGVINASSVRLRDGAGYESNTLGYYDTGTEMTVLGISGEWYNVECYGVNGYVHSDYLTLASNSSETNADITISASGSSGEYSAVGQRIVDSAYKYLGVPYVWGGTSPSGFDCSGFVYYVFQENGYSTNRTAATLFQNGTYVDKSQLKVGDIICFYDGAYTSIGHVGIYIGNNQMIHAASTPQCIAVSDITQSYYVNHYYGARRIAS